MPLSILTHSVLAMPQRNLIHYPRFTDEELKGKEARYVAKGHTAVK